MIYHSDMIFNLKNPFEQQKFKEYVNKLFKEECVAEVKRKKPLRTLKQNSYLYLLLGFFASEYGCTLDEAKVIYYKRTCNKEIFEVERVNKRGRRIMTLRSSADLDTREMTISIERFRNWSSSEVGIYLPAPNEEDMLIYAQQCIEQNQEFI